MTLYDAKDSLEAQHFFVLTITASDLHEKPSHFDFFTIQTWRTHESSANNDKTNHLTTGNRMDH